MGFKIDFGFVVLKYINFFKIFVYSICTMLS